MAEKPDGNDRRLPSHSRSGTSFGIERARRGRLTKPPRTAVAGCKPRRRDTRQPRQSPAGSSRTGDGTTASSQIRADAATLRRRRRGKGRAAREAAAEGSGSASRRDPRRQRIGKPRRDPPGLANGGPCRASRPAGEPGRRRSAGFDGSPNRSRAAVRSARRGRKLSRQWGPVATPAPISVRGSAHPPRPGEEWSVTPPPARRPSARQRSSHARGGDRRARRRSRFRRLGCSGP